jgi:folate-dependent phosphoribosylglycinamide formyltransferase PurN
MSDITPLLPPTKNPIPHAAIFLSGSGSNAEEIIKVLRSLENPPLELMALVTDAPKTSRAKELAEQYGLPLVAVDIREFYAQHGESRVSIATPKGQELRKAWTDELRRQIAPLRLDFAVFAGFVPLTNLTEDFPCLNVHPGDLTYCKNGERLLVGLHTVPIERAILEGLDSLRSSVIIALPYSGKGGEMDNGPVLGISGEVPIELDGVSHSTLLAAMRKRPLLRPRGGFDDCLENVAKKNQEKLKRYGDLLLFPRVLIDYAEGRFAMRDDKQLMYRIGDKWHPIKTLIYHQNGHKELVH